MTSITPTPEPGSSQNSSLPLLTSFILIGGFVLILVVLLGGINPSTGGSTAQPTEIAAIDVTAEATQPVIVATVEATVEATIEATAEATTESVDGVEVAALPYTADQIRQGESLYLSTCSACHGMTAQGVPGLGKNLVDSEFVLALTDPELHDFIVVGRQPWDPGNTTGIAMPARGGNPLLTDDQIDLIIAYIRSLESEAGHTFPAASGESTDSAAQPTTESTVEAAAPTAAPTEAATQAAAVEATTETDSADTTPAAEVTPFVISFPAQASYTLSCAGCHGIQGEGVQTGGLNVAPLADSEIINDDEAVFAFLTEIHPYVTDGGFVHPARGSEPILNDEQLRALIDYMQELVAGSS